MTTPEVRAHRLTALRAARDYVANLPQMSKEGRLEAAKDLAEYKVFNANMIGTWLGLSPRALRETHRINLNRGANWGIERLHARHLDLAVELARAGVARERPKTLILEAREAGMSFIQIGGLLDEHRQVPRRIYGKLNGENWQETH